MAALQIGTAQGHPGRISYGAVEAVVLPSGGVDQFPVILAQGRSDGPVLWVTASIHGAEYTGVAVIHNLITPELVSQLRGAIVAIPTLNPAGLRTAERSAYYIHGQDPNRLFPESTHRPAHTGDPIPPSPMELAYRRLFDDIASTASYLIDLHNYSIGAIPFALRDPIYYTSRRDKPAADAFQAKVGEMLTAFGHTVINEFASVEYRKQNLHRSVSGSALNTAGIPAFTVELGGYLTVDSTIVAAAVAGLRNVMRWAGMLDDAPEAITGIPILNPGYPIRRINHPYAPTGGIVSYRVRVGDTVRAKDPVARLTDIYGRPIGPHDGLVRSEHDGIVLGLTQGLTCYQSDPLVSLAIKDEGALVLPLPG
ncbi:MAG TPA: succinylglutamate desuccinylase/aspartoacylase family protein [Aggregatilineales bacterium]|nr:succinylglutamate desuccinylase/aspartoacylase family protein [Aggregatilineales bacterium]